MDFEESDFEEIVDNEYEDRDTLRRTKQALGLTRNYVPSWTSRDAFREFFQNWIDGMVESRRVLRDEIRIIIRNQKDEWLATAHHPLSGEMIGFIKFLKSKGTLEITNFGAQLSRKALDMGATSKRSKDGLAGTHGEGFKVASLVMVRKCHQVRYESANFYWTFSFGGREKRHLYCHLNPMRDTEIEKRKRAEAARVASGQPRETKANIWEDVSVKIGKVYGKNGDPIDFSTFESWIKVSLALEKPTRMFQSARADLIMDKNFAGRMYLKGLFLGTSSHSRDVKFAYNFHEGEISRDREHLSNAGEEAKLLAKVWAEAIRRDEPDAVKEYTKMLREDHIKKWADVNLARDHIDRITAAAIWRHLKALDPGSELFYYHLDAANKDTQEIRLCLKKEPEPLPTCIWAPLSRFGLVRTPKEHRYHLLINAETSDIDTTYAKAMKRALNAALALDNSTSKLKVVFKCGDRVDLDLLIDGSNLVINDKWLNFDAIHVKHPCWISQLGRTNEDFLCDHVITHLYHLILRQFKIADNERDGELEIRTALRIKVAENIRQMPRVVEVRRSPNPGQLVVSWTLLESNKIYRHYGLSLKYQVILHRKSTCSDRAEDVLFSLDDKAMEELSEDAQKAEPCGCPCQIVSQIKNGVNFRDLDPGEFYFAAVAKTYYQAFIGISSNAERPLIQPKTNGNRAETPALMCTASIPTVSWLGTDADHSHNDTSAISDSEEDSGTPSNINSSSIAVAENSKKAEASSTSKAKEGNKSQSSAPVSNLEKLKSKTNEIKSLSEASRSKEQQLNIARRNLRSKEQELSILTERFETKEFELRRAIESHDADLQKFGSQIEDLRGENEQLREIQGEREAQCTQLSDTVTNLHQKIEGLQQGKAETEVQRNQFSDTIDNLREEVQKLKQAKIDVDIERDYLATRLLSAESERGIDNSASELPRASEANDKETSETSKLLAENKKLAELNSTIKSELTQAKAETTQAKSDQRSMATTLQLASDMIKGALRLGPGVSMNQTLEGVLGMIRGILNIQKAAAPASIKAEGVKRERIKDEDDNLGTGAGAGIDVNTGSRSSKRSRRSQKDEVIELDD